MDNKAIQLSPSSLDLYLECQHCFWLDKKLGIKRPPPYPYALNIAVDLLLKKEFDQYRAKNEPHPLLVSNKIQAKLFGNQKLLDQWRSNFSGIRYYDAQIGATIFGAVDDVLEFPGGKLAPLDYKTTGSSVSNIYDRFQLQMDVYTYLLEKNGFPVTRKGYLAFYVVDKGEGFNDRLPFKKELHEIDTNPDDIPDLFKEAVASLKRAVPAPHSKDCKFGLWLRQASKFNQN